jgi:hypothetical protein
MAKPFREPLWTEVTLRLKNKKVVTGVVQGSGGLIRDLKRRSAEEQVRVLIDRANDGDPLSVYEPKPGHVKLWQGMSVGDNGKGVVVNLKGARVVRS